MMRSRILLIRHGRSAHVHREGWIDAAGVERWRTGYDAAGILADDGPPPSLVAEAERAGLVVSSDMPRAIASAGRLAPNRSVVHTPLLRESPLAIPPLALLRLPLIGWGVLINLRWAIDLARGIDGSPEELRRASDAALWLEDSAREHSTIVAVTHGVFRRMVATQLHQRGWRAETGRRSYRHWSMWPFARDL